MLKSDLTIRYNMSQLSDLTNLTYLMLYYCDILYLKIRSDFSIKYVIIVRSDKPDIFDAKIRSDFKVQYLTIVNLTNLTYLKLKSDLTFRYNVSQLSDLTNLSICYQKS